VGGGHAGGRRGRAAHRELLLVISKRGEGPQGRHRRWRGAELTGAACSGWPGRRRRRSSGLGKRAGAAAQGRATR
jgi:hypothetical protein